jgi:hypothetical protein
VIDGPTIQNVDILTDTIFAANNTGTIDQDGLPPDLYPQIEWRSTTTNHDTVIADGLLAIVAIDTTGFPSGNWVLGMNNTLNGSTDFTFVPAHITDGMLIIP